MANPKMHPESESRKALSARLERDSIPEPNSGCYLWLGALSAGYGQLQWAGRRHGAHRLAWQNANGPIPVGAVIRHKCDTPACINPDHLIAGTVADNVADREARGRTRVAYGRRHYLAKITEDQVRAIRLDERLHTQIAADYRIDISGVGHIKKGRTWGHVK